MPRIRVTPPHEAEGDLKAAYERIAGSRGSIANVHQIGSADPALMLAHLDFYMTLMYGKGGLTRRERELLATATSRANACEYCVTHHAEALARYEKREDVVAAIASGEDHPALSARDRAFIAHALVETREPATVRDAHIERLRGAGLDDRDILAATAVVAYFNFVNRLVLTLGVELEPSPARSYRY